MTARCPDQLANTVPGIDFFLFKSTWPVKVLIPYTRTVTALLVMAKQVILDQIAYIYKQIDDKETEAVINEVELSGGNKSAIVGRQRSKSFNWSLSSSKRTKRSQTYSTNMHHPLETQVSLDAGTP